MIQGPRSAAGRAILPSMVIAPLDLVAAIAGLVLYIVASNAKVAEVGRILFFVGLLALLLASGAAHGLRLG